MKITQVPLALYVWNQLIVMKNQVSKASHGTLNQNAQNQLFSLLIHHNNLLIGHCDLHWLGFPVLKPHL